MSQKHTHQEGSMNLSIVAMTLFLSLPVINLIVYAFYAPYTLISSVNTSRSPAKGIMLALVHIAAITALVGANFYLVTHGHGALAWIGCILAMALTAHVVQHHSEEVKHAAPHASHT